MYNNRFIYFTFCFLCAIALSLTGCKSVGDRNLQTKVKEDPRWQIEAIAPDLTLYSFVGQYYAPYDAHQTVRVLAMPKNSQKLRLALLDILPQDSLSQAVTVDPSIIAAVNGTYFEKSLTKGSSTAYLKINNTLIDSVEVDQQNQFYWKHEGALFFSQDQMRIARGTNATYGQAEEANIMSGSPILIENGHPVGATFVKTPDRDLTRLHYEDPERHQGVRHPRTALALTSTHILLVAVDGRSTVAAGMSAKELTLFLQHYFPVEDALNLDGGGSTTMWVDVEQLPNAKQLPNAHGVLNYPSDNRKEDHLGQRQLRNAIVIKKVK